MFSFFIRPNDRYCESDKFYGRGLYSKLLSSRGLSGSLHDTLSRNRCFPVRWKSDSAQPVYSRMTLHFEDSWIWASESANFNCLSDPLRALRCFERGTHFCLFFLQEKFKARPKSSSHFRRISVIETRANICDAI